MTQYQSDPIAAASNKISDSKSTKAIAELREQVVAQQRELDQLKRAIKKLQNEVRVAVNTFNLSRHG